MRVISIGAAAVVGPYHHQRRFCFCVFAFAFGASYQAERPPLQFSRDSNPDGIEQSSPNEDTMGDDQDNAKKRDEFDI